MKVWEKIARDNNLQDEKAVKVLINNNCPVGFESNHNYIGEKRLNRFCNLGCSPICTDEYLDLTVKEVDHGHKRDCKGND